MNATVKHTHFLQNRTSSGGLAERIGAALRGAYGKHGADKAIARDADADHRTAQAWLYGRTAPRSADLLELMASNDHLADEINALVREMKEHKRCQLDRSCSASGGAGSVLTVDRRRLCTSPS